MENRKSADMAETSPLKRPRVHFADTVREKTPMDTNQDDEFVEVQVEDAIIDEWGESAVEEYYATDDETTFESPIEDGEWLCVDHKDTIPEFFGTHDASPDKKHDERKNIDEKWLSQDQMKKFRETLSQLRQKAQMSEPLRLISTPEGQPCFSSAQDTLDPTTKLLMIQRRDPWLDRQINTRNVTPESVHGSYKERRLSILYGRPGAP